MSRKVLLFDYDGVVGDTESCYSHFWETEGKRFTGCDGLADKVKGTTLVSIFERFFPDEGIQKEITRAVHEFESSMGYEYIPGVVDFLEEARRRGFKTALVTSSDLPKMEAVYARRPEIKILFDEILTSEDFSASKPDPDPYLRAMARFGADPGESVVFEDSVNGLKSGKASGAFVVGLSTTNSRDAILKYCDYICDDFKEMREIFDAIM